MPGISDREVLDFIALRKNVEPFWQRQSRDLSAGLREATQRQLRVDTEILVHWIHCTIWHHWNQPREEAIKAAVYNDSPEVLQALRETLRAWEPRIRAAAALTLAHLHDTDSIQPIVDLLPNLQRYTLWPDFRKVLQALEILGDPGVIPQLESMLPTSPNQLLPSLEQAISHLGDIDPRPTTFTSEQVELILENQMDAEAWASIRFAGDTIGEDGLD